MRFALKIEVLSKISEGGIDFFDMAFLILINEKELNLYFRKGSRI